MISLRNSKLSQTRIQITRGRILCQSLDTCTINAHSSFSTNASYTAASSPPNSSSTVSAVPRTLILRLYRQLLRSARAYSKESQARELKVSHELQRLLSVPRRSATAWGGGLSQSMQLSPSLSAISQQLETWLQRRPTLFYELAEPPMKKSVVLEKLKNSQLNASKLDAAAEAAAASNASSPAALLDALDGSILPTPPTVDPTPKWVLAAYEANLENQILSPRWLLRMLRRSFRLPLTKDLSISARMSNAFALNKRMNERTLDLSFLPVTPLYTTATTTLPGYVRVSLRSLGLFKSFPTTSATKGGSSVSGSGGGHFFQLEWKVENISDKSTLVLVSRDIRTHERNNAATTAFGGTSSHAPATAVSSNSTTTSSSVAAGAITSRTPPFTSTPTSTNGHTHTANSSASSLGGPGSPHPPPASNSTPSAYVGGAPLSPPGGGGVLASFNQALRTGMSGFNAYGAPVSSQGVGLRGRPVVLTPGSTLQREISTIRLDHNVGVLTAELRFHDISTNPPKMFHVSLEPILLDAYAPALPMSSKETTQAASLSPTATDPFASTSTYRKPQKDDHRDMLSAVYKQEVSQQPLQDSTNKEGTNSKTPSSAPDENKKN